MTTYYDEEIAAKIANLTEDDDICVLWKFDVNKAAYPLFSLDKKIRSKSKHVHKALYELKNGKLKTGNVLSRLCEYRRCINPNHYKEVTQQESNIINARKGQYVFSSGDRFLIDKYHPKDYETKVIMSYVILDGDCWTWTNRFHPNGMPMLPSSLSFRYHTMRANQAAYEKRHGKLDVTLRVKPTCGNPKCINPDHMMVFLPELSKKDQKGIIEEIDPFN